MSWIALKMLVGDKAKFLGITLGLTFAALLIMQQGSIFCGLMLRTAGQIADITGADLWVMDPNVAFIDDGKPMLEANLYRVAGVEGVKWAVPLYKGNGRAKHTIYRKGLKPGEVDVKEVNESVILLGLEDTSLVGAPKVVLAGSLDDLRAPDAVMIDRVGLRRLLPDEGWDKLDATRDSETWTNLREKGFYDHPKLKKRFELNHVIGLELEMNDHRAVIVGICEATRTFQSNAVLYTTYTRAKQFIPQERKPLSFILAKANSDDPADRKKVAEAITRRTGLQALTSEEFSQKTIDYFLYYTGIPINFGITTFLGFLVGTAIAGQTFYNFTIENLKQFGSLKAMGATNMRIVGMILLQATLVGLLGYGLGVGLASAFGAAIAGTELAFYTPWKLLPATGGAIVLICILSSLLSVRRVIVLEPAVVFRG